MRTDVKVGIALGAIVLIVAVSYYGSQKDTDIPLDNASADVRTENAKVIDELFTQAGGSDPQTTPAEQQADEDGLLAQAPEGAQSSASVDPLTSDDPREEDEPDVSPPFAFGQDDERSAAGALLHDADSLAGASRDEDPRSTFTPQSTSIPRQPERPDQLRGQGSTRASLDRSSDAHEFTTPGTSEFAAGAVQRPAMASDVRTHVIQRGDTFSELAETYYGGQRFARFLADVNPDADPYHLRIGTKLKIPPLPKRVETIGSSQREPVENEYRVERDDSLYGIAARLLGSGERWRELYQLNREKIGPDPSKLRVGQILKLPQENAVSRG